MIKKGVQIIGIAGALTCLWGFTQTLNVLKTHLQAPRIAANAIKNFEKDGKSLRLAFHQFPLLPQLKTPFYKIIVGGLVSAASGYYLRK